MDLSTRTATAMRPETVADLMRREFITVSVDESLREALQIMRLARLRHLLVERDGALVGVLSYRDLQERVLERLEEAAPSRRRRRGAGAGDALDALSVEGTMVAAPFAVTPDTRLDAAAARITRLGVGCLPVVQPDVEPARLVGLVTESDLLRAAFPSAGGSVRAT